MPIYQIILEWSVSVELVIHLFIHLLDNGGVIAWYKILPSACILIGYNGYGDKSQTNAYKSI